MDLADGHGRGGGNLFEPGRNCWRIERAERFALIVDAAAYFQAARAAMIRARKSILLVGWDFNPEITLPRGEDGDDGPEKLSEFMIWLADRTPGLEIRLLRWDTGALKSFLKPAFLRTAIRWKAHERIALRLDGTHPLGSSHHQKMIAIDDRLAFCGGIDMTDGRYDDRDHADDAELRIGTDGKPYGPWHDAASVFDGDAAVAIGDLARQRWLAAQDEELPRVTGGADCWPDGLAPLLTDIDLSIARTFPQMDEHDEIHEIEALYLDLIANARDFIYAESQYFASRRVAHALAQRLAEDNPPEIVIINPKAAEGWLEPVAMDTARARLVEALRRIDRKGRFRLYHPVTERGEDIYVHAKLSVIDDRYLRVGSSNFNNRSLRFDTECDVALDGTDVTGQSGGTVLTDIRHDLLAEHLGVTPDKVAAHEKALGSMIAAIEELRGQGRTLIPYELPELSETEKWLADNEILDPEGPDAIFEPLSQRGLFRHWHFPHFRRRNMG